MQQTELIGRPKQIDHFQSSVGDLIKARVWPPPSDKTQIFVMFLWKQKKGLMQCFSNIFSPSSPFHSRQGSKFKGFYLKKVWNSSTKPLKSWTRQLYYDANITFRILVKIIQGYGAGAQSEGAGSAVQLKIWDRSRSYGIWDVAPGPFLFTNGFAK